VKIRNQLLKYGAVVAGVVLSGVAAATPAPAYDVSDATTAIGGGNSSIAELGVAALVMIVGIKVWKRLRGAA